MKSGHFTSGQLSLASFLRLDGRVPAHPGTCLQSPTASVFPAGAVRFLELKYRPYRRCHHKREIVHSSPPWPVPTPRGQLNAPGAKCGPVSERGRGPRRATDLVVMWPDEVVAIGSYAAAISPGTDR